MFPRNNYFGKDFDIYVYLPSDFTPIVEQLLRKFTFTCLISNHVLPFGNTSLKSFHRYILHFRLKERNWVLSPECNT